MTGLIVGYCQQCHMYLVTTAVHDADGRHRRLTVSCCGPESRDSLRATNPSLQ